MIQNLLVRSPEFRIALSTLHSTSFSLSDSWTGLISEQPSVEVVDSQPHDVPAQRAHNVPAQRDFSEFEESNIDSHETDDDDNEEYEDDDNDDNENENADADEPTLDQPALAVNIPPVNELDLFDDGEAVPSPPGQIEPPQSVPRRHSPEREVAGSGSGSGAIRPRTQRQSMAPSTRVRGPGSGGAGGSSFWNLSTVWIGNIPIVERTDQSSRAQGLGIVHNETFDFDG